MDGVMNIIPILTPIGAFEKNAINSVITVSSPVIIRRMIPVIPQMAQKTRDSPVHVSAVFSWCIFSVIIFHSRLVRVSKRGPKPFQNHI